MWKAATAGVCLILFLIGGIFFEDLMAAVGVSIARAIVTALATAACILAVKMASPPGD